MKLLFAAIIGLSAQAGAQIDRMDYDTIAGRDYFAKRHVDPKTGKEVRWAVEFLENKDTFVIYKVEGEKMTAAASYLLKIDFEAGFQSAQSFAVPGDKRPVFAVELRDRVNDTRHVYILDPLKDAESPRFQTKIRTDDYEMKLDKDTLKFEWTDADSKARETRTWNSAR